MLMRDLKDLIKELENNKEKEVKSFDQLVEYYQCLNDRNLLIGQIDYEIAIAVDSVIRFWNKADEEEGIPVDLRKPIKIYIHSPGGYLTSTFTMIDAIKMSKTPVYTIAIGEVYSGGFFTFLAGHKKYAYPHSSFLYHEGATANGGDANKFRNFAKFYETQLNQLKQIVLENSKITEEEYNKHIKDDWWLTAEEAVEYGIVDEIMTELI